KKIFDDFWLNVADARAADPTQQNDYVIFQNNLQQPHFVHRFSPRPAAMQPGPMRPTRFVRTTIDTKDWKQRSLACVIALQKIEQNLQDSISLCDAFDQSTDAQVLKDAFDRVGAIRAK